VQFDRHQSFSDQPLTICPECHKKSLRKVIAPVGIVFKGSGWYATDHKSPSGTRNTANAKSEAKEAAPASTESKTPATTPSE
jgi:putative FmdB family regulatory protein